jgi:hypothetical protein
LVLSFFFTKLENRRVEGGAGPVNRVRAQKDAYDANTEILCTHVCKCKNDNLLKQIQELAGGGGVKESCGGGEFKYDIFDTL